MNFFGRNKEEELEEVELQEEQERKLNIENRKLKKKLRDLDPENKGKRQEPIKPWGKKERLIVGLFFTITTLIATFLFLSSHEYKFPGLPQITLKGINLKNPFSEKVIELGQKSISSANDDRAINAINEFKRATRPLSGSYGFIVIRLTDGGMYGTEIEKTFQGASLIKLPVMVLAYQLHERGEFNLDDIYTLKDGDKVKGAGILSFEDEGKTYSYRELIEFMGKHSDRTAYKVLKDVITPEKVNLFLAENGMSATNIETGDTTPGEMAHLLDEIFNTRIISESAKSEIMQYLTNTDFESWIPVGVPQDVRVAHKVGIDSGVLTDAAIVESQNPYILVLMGQGINREETDLFYPEFSKYVYDVENTVQ